LVADSSFCRGALGRCGVPAGGRAGASGRFARSARRLTREEARDAFFADPRVEHPSPFSAQKALRDVAHPGAWATRRDRAWARLDRLAWVGCSSVRRRGFAALTLLAMVRGSGRCGRFAQGGPAQPRADTLAATRPVHGGARRAGADRGTGPRGDSRASDQRSLTEGGRIRAARRHFTYPGDRRRPALQLVCSRFRRAPTRRAGRARVPGCGKTTRSREHCCCGF